jgi:hypothetical protein
MGRRQFRVGASEITTIPLGFVKFRRFPSPGARPAAGAPQCHAVPVSLPELLRTHMRPEGHPVEEAIFCTNDPDRVADMIERAALEQLRVPVAGGAFYTASSGCVIGLHLTDGRTVVLKAYQPRWEPSFLQAVQRVQRALCEHGIPCPAPIVGPVPIGRGWATVEAYLPDPGRARVFDDGALSVSSAGLATLVGAAHGVEAAGLARHPLRVPPGALYPEPHSPIFDLATTGAGAEWIDEIARKAWAGIDRHALPHAVAHLDWSANNVRLGADRVTAVYDLDSLALAPEAVTAGQAAATWRSTGESGDLRAPEATEVARFVAAYAAARGAPFTPAEVAVAHAAAVSVMAYTARCEHALEERTPWRRTRARDWLRAEATLLL